jgi:hypothetical protein
MAYQKNNPAHMFKVHEAGIWWMVAPRASYYGRITNELNFRQAIAHAVADWEKKTPLVGNAMRASLNRPGGIWGLCLEYGLLDKKFRINLNSKGEWEQIR